MPEAPIVDPVAPPAPSQSSNLPESFGMKPNNDFKTDIDKFFVDDPVDQAPAVAQPPAPTAPKAEPKAEPPQAGSLAAKLAGKKAPVAAPKTETPAAPAAPEDPVAKIESEMRTHDPKWKPAKGWEVMKAAIKTEAELRAKVERKLAEAEAKANAPLVAGLTADEIEALKTREKAASDRLMVMDLESHPQYRAQFIDPKNTEVSRANEILNAAGVKANVAELLGKPRSELGKAVSELVKDLPDFDRVEVAEAIRKAYTLEQQGKLALTQSKELAKGLQTQSVQKQRDAFARRWAPVSAALGEHIVELEVPNDATAEQRASIEGYNADLKGLRGKAEEIAFSPMNEESIAEAAMKAAAYDFHITKAMPRIISEYEEVVNLNRQLASELQALKGRNPNHNVSAPPSNTPNSESDPAKMSHAAAAEHFFRQ